MTLWLVGKVKACEPAGAWDFQGVFDDEVKALAACRSAGYFMAEVGVNQELSEDAIGFPRAVFPHVQAVVQ